MVVSDSEYRQVNLSDKDESGELTDSDMRELLAGTASAEVRQEYAEQLKDPDSFANRWMDAIHAAASDPFDIDMTRDELMQTLTAESEDGETGPPG